MKSCHSTSLGKEVFDEYRHFLSKNHRYCAIENHILNGKEETILKPRRMTPQLWKLEYNRNHHEGHMIPRGMKNYPTYFMRFLYYEHLIIAHFFDKMHIGNNETNFLW